MIDYHSNAKFDHSGEKVVLHPGNGSVELLGDLNCEKESYIISRPGITEKATKSDLELLSNIDLSLHSMRTMVLKMRSSYLFKLFISSINGVTLWSVGKRFSPYENLEVEAASINYLDKLNARCNEIWEMYNDPRILYKNLPAGLLVDYVISLDERTLNSIIYTINSEYNIYSRYSELLEDILGKEAYSAKLVSESYGFSPVDKSEFTGPSYEYPTQQSEVKTIEYNTSLIDFDDVINHPHILIHSDIYSIKSYYYEDLPNTMISLGHEVKGTFTGDPDTIDSIKRSLLKKYSYDDLK